MLIEIVRGQRKIRLRIREHREFNEVADLAVEIAEQSDPSTREKIGEAASVLRKLAEEHKPDSLRDKPTE